MHAAIRKRALQVTMSHSGQRWEIKARLLKHEIKATVNKALIKMIIPDPLGIAESTFLVYSSCFYSK